MGCAAKQIPEYLLPWSTVNLPKHVNLHLELDKDIGFLFLSYNWALTLNCNSQLWVTALTLSSDSHLWLSALTLSSSSQLWLDSDSQLWLSHSGCLDPKKFFPLLIHPQGSQGCQKITFFFHEWKCFHFALRLPPKETNSKKPSKLKRKCQKTLFS